jgi:acetyl esterase/lipase
MRDWPARWRTPAGPPPGRARPGPAPADEGEALARQLSAGGADVRYRPPPGLMHGFLSLGEVSPAAAQATGQLFRDYGALVRATRSAAS